MNRYDLTRERFLSAVRRGCAPHATLISGADESFCTELALAAASIFCTGEEAERPPEDCPDFFWLGREKYEVEQIRALREELRKRPFTENRVRVILLEGAQRMNEASQNALLKTLEEPPSRTAFLLTGNEAGVLLTIRSRCSTVRLFADPKQTEQRLIALGCSKAEAEEYTRLSGGVFADAKAFLEDENRMPLRESAAKALFETVRGTLPNPLTLRSSADKEQATERARERGMFALNVMLSLLSDEERIRLKLAPAVNPELCGKWKSAFSGVSDAKLQHMIALTLSAQERMNYNSKPELTLDSLLIDICTQNSEEK